MREEAAPRTFAELPVPDGDDGPCVLAVVDEPQGERLHALLGVAQLRQLLLQRRLREGRHGGGPARAGPAPPAGEGATQPHRQQPATAATRWPPDLSPRRGGSKGTIVRIAGGRRGETATPGTDRARRAGRGECTAHARPQPAKAPRGTHAHCARPGLFSQHSPSAAFRCALFVALTGPGLSTSLPPRGRPAPGAGRRAGPQGPPRARVPSAAGAAAGGSPRGRCRPARRCDSPRWSLSRGCPPAGAPAWPSSTPPRRPSGPCAPSACS